MKMNYDELIIYLANHPNNYIRIENMWSHSIALGSEWLNTLDNTDEIYNYELIEDASADYYDALIIQY